MITGASELVGPYHYDNTMRRLIQRAGFVIAVGALAVLCLSSAMLAAVVGVVIAAIVAVDMLVLAPRRRPPADLDTPERLSVDLSRRQ